MVVLLGRLIQFFELLQLLNIDPAALLIEQLLGWNFDIGCFVLIPLGNFFNHVGQHLKGGSLFLIRLQHKFDEPDNRGIMVELAQFFERQPGEIRRLEAGQFIEGNPEAIHVVLNQAVRGLEPRVFVDQLQLR